MLYQTVLGVCKQASGCISSEAQGVIMHAQNRKIKRRSKGGRIVEMLPFEYEAQVQGRPQESALKQRHSTIVGTSPTSTAAATSATAAATATAASSSSAAAAATKPTVAGTDPQLKQVGSAKRPRDLLSASSRALKQKKESDAASAKLKARGGGAPVASCGPGAGPAGVAGDVTGAGSEGGGDGDDDDDEEEEAGFLAL